MNHIMRMRADSKEPHVAWIIAYYNWEVNILKLDLLKNV